MKVSLAGARVRLDEVEAILRRARDWATRHSADVLLADAGVVFGEAHLASAAIHATRAHAAGTAVARTLSMEALRYLSGQRQVADAIRVTGLRAGTRGIAIVVFGADSADGLLEEMGWRRDDRVLEARGKQLSALGITKAEEGSVPEERRPDLALERVALLDVTK